jgi:FADH2 O2-dependent halogenase
MNHVRPDFEVGIIGGGPAGASLAAYLAKAGVSCIICERDLFPRPHVGESFVPSSTRVFQEIGFLRAMEENNFPHKHGAVWTVGPKCLDGRQGWADLEPNRQASIRFDERLQEGVSQSYTYHVDRGKFDFLLLQHANHLGATVYSGVNVKDVDLDVDGLVQLRTVCGRREFPIRVRMLVDASGRRTFLGNKFRLRVNDPVFDQYAIHSWFADYDRGSKDQSDFIFIHFAPIDNTWIWQIPISESVTSIGVVTQKETLRKYKLSHEQLFWNCIKMRPDLFERLSNSKRIRPFNTEGDYSYAMREICGHRFLMIGDAARFVDPIFSTGVSIALNSARMAALDIVAALDAGDCRRHSFRSFETTIRRGTRNWYEFIAIYYRLNILFTAFINNPNYRLDVLKLLQGDVYDETEPEVLRKMREVIQVVERDNTHIWHSKLGVLTADVLRSAFA